MEDSNRAETGELNVGVARRRPLTGGGGRVSPTNSDKRSFSGLQTINDYSIFGSSSVSVASSVARTITDGVQHSIAHWKVLLFGQLISFFLAVAGAASEELNGRCNVSIPVTQTTLVGCLLMISGARKMKGWGSRWSRVGQQNEKDWNNHQEEEASFCSHDEDQKQTISLQPPLNHTRKDEQDEGSMLSGKAQPRLFCFGLQTIHAPLWLYFVAGLVAVEARYLIFLSFKYTTFTFIYLVDALAIPSAIAFSKLLLKREYHFVHLLGGLVCITGIVTNTVSDLRGTENETQQIGLREDVNPGQFKSLCH